MKVLTAAQKIRLIAVSSIIVLLASWGVAYAQFEGSFDIHQRLFSDNGSQVKEGKVSVLVTGDRIRVNGLDGSRMPEQLGGMKTNSILIRLDKKDFILFGDNSTAVQIQKAEIVNMLNLVNSVQSHMAGEDTSNTKANFSTTKEKRKIEGYPCQKVIIRKFEDGKEITAVVWITNKIPVNWGMLTEPWGDDKTELAEILSPLWLKNGTLPIFAEIMKDGKKMMTIQIEHIEKRKITNTQVKVPSSVHLVSFRQMLLQKMFGG